MIHLPNVTLYGADTIDLTRQLKAFAICEKHASFGAKKSITNTLRNYTTESGIEIINTDKINSLRDYNQFNLKHLNDFVDTEFVMVAEHDGFILNPNAWTREFLKYDYIGAPLWVEDKLVVGNGGFSIRSKRLLELVQNDDNIQLGTRAEHKYAENEDWTICVTYRKYLEEKGIRFAPVELAHNFSFEKNAKYGNKWTGQFGFHGLTRTDISIWLEKNPEWKIMNALSHKLNINDK